MHVIHGVWQNSDTLGRLVLVAVIVAACAQALFVIEFGSRPWYRSGPKGSWQRRVGRALMLKSASLGALLLLSVVDTFLTYPGQRIVAAVVVFAVTIAIVYQLAALLLSPRRLEDPRDDELVGG